MASFSSDQLTQTTQRVVRGSAFTAIALALAACGGGDPLDPLVGSDPADKYSISGQVTVVDSAALDSDTNDPNQTARASNNSLDTPQVLASNPVTVSGYLNMAGQGSQGATFANGDQIDTYSIRLEKGQVVELDFVAPTRSADVDLRIYNSAQDLVGVSESTTSSYECVRIEESGTYSVVALLFNGSTGGTIYQTRVGAPGVGSNCLNTTNIQSIVVPGELIVEPAKTDVLALKASNRRPYQATVAQGTMAPKHRALIKVPADLNTLSGTSAVKAKSVGSTDLVPGSRKSSKTRELEKTLLTAKLMRNSDQFETVSLNYRYELMQTSPQLIGTFPPNDRIYYAQAWHYDAIELTQAMAAIGQISPAPTRRPIVAVVDSGVVTNHPDLVNMLVPGIDSISDPSISLDGDGVDSNPFDDTVDGPGGSGFHGTHVSGTIAAQTFNGIYGAGVAPMAQIMPIRSLGKGGGTTMDILEGISWAAGLPNSTGIPGPAQTADIFNLSLGGARPCSASEENVFAQLRAKGIITVVATGNASERGRLNPVGGPANCDSVIAVGSTDARNGRSYFSNGGPELDVVAPGGDMTSRSTGSGLSDGIASLIGVFSGGGVQPDAGLMQGTSMATPHAAGIFALMKFVAPNITQVDIENLIASNKLTKDLGPVGRDNEFGVGLLSARLAVQEAQALAGGGGTQPPGSIQVQPSSLALGSIRAEAELELSAIGDTADTITNVTADNAAITVTARNVNSANGFGTYAVSVDRNQIPAGQTLFAKVLVGLSSGGRLEVSVTAQQSGGGLNGTVGPIYVLVIDRDASTSSNTAVAEQSATFAPVNGRYQYTVADIPNAANRVSVYAGSDIDNDGLICDQGEACGAYPLLGSQTQVLEPTGNLTGIDFTAEPQSGLDGNSSLNESIGGATINGSGGIRRLR